MPDNNHLGSNVSIMAVALLVSTNLAILLS